MSKQCLTFRYLHNTGSVCPLVSCVLSNNKYVYTCMTYYKSKNINHKNCHDMPYKCKVIDIYSIQYHLIYIRITHHFNIHFDLEMYMIIITIMINMCIMHQKYDNMFNFTHTVRYICIIFMFTCSNVLLCIILKNYILLIIIVNLRNISTTAHKNKFMIPIQIPIHNLCNVAVSEMIYKDHQIQITCKPFYQHCCDLFYMICNFCNWELLHMTYQDHHVQMTYNSH